MKEFCENEFCEGEGFKEVRVSAEKAGDGKRTFCVPCENAFSVGVQHATIVAKAELAKELTKKDRLIAALQRRLRRIVREAQFSEDDGVMDLGERLLEIEKLAAALLPEKGAKGAKAQ